MSHAASIYIRSLPALLLGLLLWGQCAFSVNEHGRYVPTVRVRVARDSLGMVTEGQPAQLYLTLAFTNHLPQACRLDTALGNVSFNRQHWALVATKVKGMVLPAQGNRLVPVVVRLVPPVDSLAAFRKALRTGSRFDNPLRIYLHVPYATASEPDSWLPVEATTYLPAQR